MILEYIVENNFYNNVNQILKQKFHISSRLLHKLIINNYVFLNGKSIDTRSSVALNDVITVDLSFKEENDNIIPTEMHLDIVYEDDGLLIINKPAGIAVHPSILHYNDSLSNGVKFYFDKIELYKKIRPVNRLDLNTSGIIVFAKNEYVQECLIKQMTDGTFYKEYIAIVSGNIVQSSGVINLPIARKDNSIIERCVSENGQAAITEYEVLKNCNDFCVVKCILKTGRTHQIRVHMSAINHPLLGDSLYGETSDLIDRHALHSYKISFFHPVSNNLLEFICDLPDDMKKLIKDL